MYLPHALISTCDITFDNTVTSSFTRAFPMYVSGVEPR